MSKKCLKCNQILDDDAIFCAACGSNELEAVVEAPVEAAAVAVEEPAVEAPVEETPVVEEAPVVEDAVIDEAAEPARKPRKKMKLWQKITAIAVPAVAVVLAALLIVLNWTAVAGFFVKMFGSDQQYMSYAAKSTVTEATDDGLKQYDKWLDALKNGSAASGTLKITVGEELEDIVSQYLLATTDGKIDLSWINNATIKFDVNSKGNAMQLGLSILDNANEFIGAKLIFDGKENVYVDLGEYANGILKLSLADAGVDMGQIEDLTGMIAEIAPESKVLDKLIERYIDIVLGCLDDVEESSDTVKIEGVEQKFTVSEITIDSKTVMSIAKEVLKAAKSDEEIKDIIKNAEKVLVDREMLDEESDIYGDFKEMVSDLLEELKNVDTSEDDEEVVLKLYINGASEVKGIVVEVEDEELGGWITVNKGKNVASKIWINDTQSGDEQVIFKGSGEVKGGKLNMKYTLTAMGEKLGTLEISDYDYKAAKDGYINGTFKITPDKEFVENYVPAGVAEIFEDISLKVTLAQSETKNSFDIKLLRESKELLGIKLDVEKKDATKVEIPSGNIVDGIENFTLDTDKLLKKFEASSFYDGISSLVEMFMSGGQDSSNDYYDDYYDDYYGDYYDDYYGDYDDYYDNNYYDDYYGGYVDEY